MQRLRIRVEVDSFDRETAVNEWSHGVLTDCFSVEDVEDVFKNFVNDIEPWLAPDDE